MNYIVVHDKLTIVKDEIWHLERLLNEANVRERNLLKRRGEQTWYDWVCELLGY